MKCRPLSVLLLGLLPLHAEGQPKPGSAPIPPKVPPVEEGKAPPAPESPPTSEPTGGEPATDAAPVPEERPDLETLRNRYLDLRDRLFRSRARSHAVSSALFSSQIRISLGYDSSRFYSITRATIRLDGATVFDDVDGQISRGKAQRFSGFVAPGRHEITVRIEAAAKDDERFRSTTEDSFVVSVPPGKSLVVSAEARDEGDIAFRFAKEGRGTYKLHLDVEVETTEGKQGGQHIKRSAREARRPRPDAS